MGSFSGLKDAKRGFASNYLQPGKYVVRIDACEYLDATANGEFWKNTLTILAVEHGEHRVGEVVHTMWKYDNTAEKKQIFQRNLKAFACGVLGCEDEEFGEEEATLAASEDSPLKGLVTVVTGTLQTSKKGKKEDGTPKQYTLFSWSPSLTKDEIVEAIGADAYKKFFPTG